MTARRRKSRTGRPASARRECDKNLYADDPLYRALGRARKRFERASRRQLVNVSRRRRWAADPDARDKARARRYGLSLQELRAILARQGNACAICKRSGQPLCIDHCHATGRVRGLLCRKCNIGLGCYQDDRNLTQAATAYLEACRGDEGSR